MIPENNAILCHSKKIPVWLVLLDNIPTLLLFILGILIISRVSSAGAVAFGAYALFSVVWFWAKICPFCQHYDTLACPCGYGAISAKIFKRRLSLDGELQKRLVPLTSLIPKTYLVLMMNLTDSVKDQSFPGFGIS
jgi:hypothetical protein